MSLSTYLQGKVSKEHHIRSFFDTKFTNAKPLSAQHNIELKKKHGIIPEVSDFPFTFVGHAIDFRLRYYFQTFIPKKYILNQVFFLIWPRTYLNRSYGKPFNGDYLRQKIKSKVFPEEWGGGLPTLNIKGDIISAKEDARLEECLTYGYYRAEVLEQFFKHFNIFLKTHQLTQLLKLEDEKLFLKYCYILGLLENIYRTGGNVPENPWLEPQARTSLDELLAIPEDHVIDDLYQLSQQFYEKCSHLLFNKNSVLNPNFLGSTDVGGADGDLIVDGCLIDVKTTIKPIITLQMLRQLIGYVILDYEDQYHIQSVGLYFSRQGYLCTWPLNYFIAGLTDGENNDINYLRSEFRSIVTA